MIPSLEWEGSVSSCSPPRLQFWWHLTPELIFLIFLRPLSMGTGCIKASVIPVTECMSQLEPLMLKGCSFLWSQLICNGLKTLFFPGFFSWPYLQHWSCETITGIVKYWHSLAPKGLFLILLVSWKWEGQVPSHRVPVNEWRLAWPQKLRTVRGTSSRKRWRKSLPCELPELALRKMGKGE